MSNASCQLSKRRQTFHLAAVPLQLVDARGALLDQLFQVLGMQTQLLAQATPLGNVPYTNPKTEGAFPDCEHRLP